MTYRHENPYPYSCATIACNASPMPFGYQFGSGVRASQYGTESGTGGPCHSNGIRAICCAFSCWQRFATHTRSASCGVPYQAVPYVSCQNAGIWLL